MNEKIITYALVMVGLFLITAGIYSIISNKKRLKTETRIFRINQQYETLQLSTTAGSGGE